MVIKLILSSFIFQFFTPVFASEPLFSLQWGLQNLGKPQAIDTGHFTKSYLKARKGEDINLTFDVLSPPARSVLVAILDTGIDLKHPELEGIIDQNAINILDSKKTVQDIHGHGTHIAGIIAAKKNNLGIQGVSEHIKILPIKVIETGPNAPIKPQSIDANENAGGTLIESVAMGILYAIKSGAKVINISLAWPTTIRSQALSEAVQMAEKKDVIIVASAGNDSMQELVYPCAFPSVICVGSHGPDGAFSYFSNFGNMVDLLAPGAQIMSTWPTTKTPKSYAGGMGYEYRNGTSMAAPFVVAVLAELISQGYTPFEARYRVLLGTRKTPSFLGFENTFTETFYRDIDVKSKTLRFGNLDAKNAFALQPQPLIIPYHKEIIELVYKSSTQFFLFPFKNIGEASKATGVIINGKNYLLPSLKIGETFDLSVPIEPDDDSINIKINNRDYIIPVRFYTNITQFEQPPGARVETIFHPFQDRPYSVRSIIQSNPSSNFLHALIQQNNQNTEIAIIQNSTQINNGYLGKITLIDTKDDQILNIYLTPENHFAILTSDAHLNPNRPTFKFNFYAISLTPLNTITIPSVVTSLPESFLWHGDQPVWLSIGLTPKPDLPKYDPWNPKDQDFKALRIYTVINNEIRIIPIPDKSLTPIQLISGEPIRAILADGSGYEQNYTLYHLIGNKLSYFKPFNSNPYRVLYGSAEINKVISLDSVNSSRFSFVGESGQSNIRISLLDTEWNGFKSDFIVSRSDPFERLVSTSGVYILQEQIYAFVQSHYDLKFFNLGKKEFRSTSLNRYSYIPSMISNKSFYPTTVLNQDNKTFPALYIPASFSNNFTSEIVVANLNQGGELNKPPELRLRVTDPHCEPVGNLIDAFGDQPGFAAFFCGTKRILIPLKI